MKISGQQQVGFGMNITIHPELTYNMSAETIKKIGEHCESIRDMYPDVFVHFKPNAQSPGSRFDAIVKKETPSLITRTNLYNFDRPDLDKNSIFIITKISNKVIRILGLDKNEVLTRYKSVFQLGFLE